MPTHDDPRSLLIAARQAMPRDPRRVLSLAERAGRGAMASGDRECAGEAWRLAGSALRRLERHDEALVAYRRSRSAFARGADRIGAARTDIGYVDALMYLDRFEEAIRVGRRALGVLLEEGEVLPAGRLLTNLGNLEYRRDRPEAALERYRQARSLLEDSAPRMDLAFADFNIANTLIQVGELDAADRLYESVRRVAGEEDNPLVVLHADYARAGLQISRLYVRVGLRGLLACEDRFAALGHERGRQNCRLDRAEAYFSLHLATEAGHLAELAFRGFRALGLRMEAARALALAGVVDLRGQERRRGRRRVAQAARTLARLGNPSLSDRLSLRLAEAQPSGGDETKVRGIRERFRAGGHRVWAAEASLELARRALVRRDLTACRRWVRLARKDAGRSASPILRARAYQLLGLAAEQDERLDSSRVALRRAARLLDGVRMALGNEELVQAHLRWARDLHHDLLRVLIASGERPDRLLESALHAELGWSGRTAGSSPSPELVELRGRWATRTEKERRFLREGGRMSDANRRRIARLEREIEEQVRRGQLHRTRPDSRRYTLVDLQGALEPGELWIHWLPTGRRVVPMLIGRERVEVLGPGVDAASVASLAEELRYQMERFLVDPEFTQRRMRSLIDGTEDVLVRLGERILGKFVSELSGAERLLICPPDRWESIPWGALSCGGRILWEGGEVMVTPSVSHFLDHRAAASDPVPGPALILAVADDDAPQAEEEARTLAGIVPGSRILTGGDATRAAFLEFAPRARIVHFAGHGRFRPESPAFSSLQLADDELIFLDLEEVGLVADLVVLSACESGRSHGGVEGTGLGRGFLRAGAKRLLLTQWKSPDRGMGPLLESIYDGIHQGRRTGEALRASALKCRDTGAHPAIWAAFHHVGMP